MMRRISVVAVVVLAIVGLTLVSLGTGSGAAVDDGYFDRWTVTSVSAAPGGQIVVSYTRDWVHPTTGTLTGSFSRTSPAPTALVLTPAWNSPLSGQTGGPQGFVLGTNQPAEVLVPGTYLLTRTITLGDGTDTYRQDIVITLTQGATGQTVASWTSTEELFVPSDEVQETPESVPVPVPAAPKTTG